MQHWCRFDRFERFLEYFFSAWNSIGVPSNPQPNNGRALDAFYSPLSLTAWNQSRSSSDTAHYRPIADKRPNFHLLALHSVSKVMINKDKEATGVQVCWKVRVNDAFYVFTDSTRSLLHATILKGHCQSRLSKKSFLPLGLPAHLDYFNSLASVPRNCLLVSR